jgi:hypothetical protein
VVIQTPDLRFNRREPFENPVRVVLQVVVPEPVREIGDDSTEIGSRNIEMLDDRRWRRECGWNFRAQSPVR